MDPSAAVSAEKNCNKYLWIPLKETMFQKKTFLLYYTVLLYRNIKFREINSLLFLADAKISSCCTDYRKHYIFIIYVLSVPTKNIKKDEVI